MHIRTKLSKKIQRKCTFTFSHVFDAFAWFGHHSMYSLSPKEKRVEERGALAEVLLGNDELQARLAVIKHHAGALHTLPAWKRIKRARDLTLQLLLALIQWTTKGPARYFLLLALKSTWMNIHNPFYWHISGFLMKRDWSWCQSWMTSCMHTDEHWSHHIRNWHKLIWKEQQRSIFPVMLDKHQ